MHIQRTAPDTSKREPWLGATPTFRNFNSHWWDAGQIYGHDHATQMKIRSKRDGKIKFDGNMLPEDPDHKGIDFTGFNDNWWIGLALLHNLFAQEHNAICDALKSAYPDWNDEELFQHARLINGALIAKIHTVEWTPEILAHPALQFGMPAQWSGVPYRWMHLLLGEDNEVSRGIVGSATDQHSAPYAMTEEFTAVYRMHPLLPDTVRIHSLKGGKPKTLDFVEVQGIGDTGAHDRARIYQRALLSRHRKPRRVAHPELPKLPAPIPEGHAAGQAEDLRSWTWRRSISCATASAVSPATTASANWSARSG